MSNIIPTLGRIVWFKLASCHAEQINRRRDDGAASIHYHSWKRNGVMVHVGSPVAEGQIVPAMVVAVHGDTPESYVNLKLFLDGSDDYWVTSVKVGERNGDYHWMPYQIGQATKHGAGALIGGAGGAVDSIPAGKPIV